MPEEVHKTSQEEVPQAEEVVVVTDAPTTTLAPTSRIVDAENEPPPSPETEEESVKPKQVEEDTEADQVTKPGGDDDKMTSLFSPKDECPKFADLSDSEKKALEELKQLVQEALNNHVFGNLTPPAESPTKEKENKDSAAAVVEKEAAGREEPTAPEEARTDPKVVPETKDESGKDEKIQMVKTDNVAEGKVPAAIMSDNDAVDDDGAKTVEAIEETIVAVSSLSTPQEQTSPQVKEPEAKAAENAKEVKSEGPVPAEEVSIWGIKLLADERSDIILLKFLRARDFKVKDAFTMLKNTIRWRNEFGIEELMEQDLGDDLEKVVFMHGSDKEGHPVCYNVYGEFQDKKLYQKTFSDEEKRQRFLRWRIQFLERSIRKLDFSHGGISTIVQVNDLKNSPGPAKRELRQATRQALQLLQDNYPEFVARQVFINVPWWYLAVNRMISPFLTQRTRSKFVFAAPSKSAETLLRYVAAEQIPIKYGGLSNDGEFDSTDAATEIIVKPASKHTVEFSASEMCVLSWEIRVVGWDVSYCAEFVPRSAESYTVIIQKAKRVAASTQESVLRNNFKNGEPGKVVLTIHNPTSKKKKLLYRMKTSTFSSD